MTLHKNPPSQLEKGIANLLQFSVALLLTHHYLNLKGTLLGLYLSSRCKRNVTVLERRNSEEKKLEIGSGMFPPQVLSLVFCCTSWSLVWLNSVTKLLSVLSDKTTGQCTGSILKRQKLKLLCGGKIHKRSYVFFKKHSYNITIMLFYIDRTFNLVVVFFVFFLLASTLDVSLYIQMIWKG